MPKNEKEAVEMALSTIRDVIDDVSFGFVIDDNKPFAVLAEEFIEQVNDILNNEVLPMIGITGVNITDYIGGITVKYSEPLAYQPDGVYLSGYLRAASYPKTVSSFNKHDKPYVDTRTKLVFVKKIGYNMQNGWANELRPVLEGLFDPALFNLANL